VCSGSSQLDLACERTSITQYLLAYDVVDVGLVFFLQTSILVTIDQSRTKSVLLHYHDHQQHSFLSVLNTHFKLEIFLTSQLLQNVFLGVCDCNSLISNRCVLR
jgi:hypothetical protein